MIPTRVGITFFALLSLVASLSAGEFELARGIRVIHERIPQGSELKYRAVVSAGPAWEEIGEEGLAAFVAFVLSEAGTSKLDGVSLSDHEEQLGFTFRGSTHGNYALFQGRLATRDLDRGLEHLLARLFDAKIEEPRLNQLAKRWLGESVAHPDTLLRAILARATFGGLDHRSRTGLVRAELDLARLGRFYRSCYQPQRLTLLLESPLDPKALSAALEKAFSTVEVEAKAREFPHKQLGPYRSSEAPTITQTRFDDSRIGDRDSVVFKLGRAVDAEFEPGVVRFLASLSGLPFRYDYEKDRFGFLSFTLEVKAAEFMTALKATLEKVQGVPDQIEPEIEAVKFEQFLVQSFDPTGNFIEGALQFGATSFTTYAEFAATDLRATSAEELRRVAQSLFDPAQMHLVVAGLDAKAAGRLTEAFGVESKRVATKDFYLYPRDGRELLNRIVSATAPDSDIRELKALRWKSQETQNLDGELVEWAVDSAVIFSSYIRVKRLSPGRPQQLISVNPHRGIQQQGASPRIDLTEAVHEQYLKSLKTATTPLLRQYQELLVAEIAPRVEAGQRLRGLRIRHPEVPRIIELFVDPETFWIKRRFSRSRRDSDWQRLEESLDDYRQCGDFWLPHVRSIYQNGILQTKIEVQTYETNPTLDKSSF